MRDTPKMVNRTRGVPPKTEPTLDVGEVGAFKGRIMWHGGDSVGQLVNLAPTRISRLA